MSIFVLTNPQVIINSVDLSNHVDQVTVEQTFADVDTTAFGSSSKTRTSGLGDHKITVEFQQDYATAEVDATLYPLIGTVTTFNIKPVNTATSTTNPAYTGSVLITDYKPLDGKIGDLTKMSLTWPVSGAITRATS